MAAVFFPAEQKACLLVKMACDSASVAARPLVALVIDLPGVGVLRFRLTSEPLAQDRRFRVIYYLPADAATMQQCAAWVAGF